MNKTSFRTTLKNLPREDPSMSQRPEPLAFLLAICGPRFATFLVNITGSSKQLFLRLIIFSTAAFRAVISKKNIEGRLKIERENFEPGNTLGIKREG